MKPLRPTRRATLLFAIIALLLVCLVHSAHAQKKKGASNKPMKRSASDGNIGSSSGILGGWFEPSAKKQAREQAAQETAERKAQAERLLSHLKGPGAAATGDQDDNSNTNSKSGKGSKKKASSTDTSNDNKDATEKKRRISKGKNFEGLLQVAQETRQEEKTQKNLGGDTLASSPLDPIAHPDQKEASAPGTETESKKASTEEKETKKESKKAEEKEEELEDDDHHNDDDYSDDIVHEHDHADNDAYDDIVWYEGSHRDDEEEIEIDDDHHHHDDEDEDEEDDDTHGENAAAALGHGEQAAPAKPEVLLNLWKMSKSDQDQQGPASAASDDRDMYQIFDHSNSANDHNAAHQQALTFQHSGAEQLHNISPREFCLRLKHECESTCREFTKTLSHLSTSCADGSVAELLFWGKCCQLGAEARSLGSSSSPDRMKLLKLQKLAQATRDEHRVLRQINERLGGEMAHGDRQHPFPDSSQQQQQESMEDAFFRRQQEFHQRAQEDLWRGLANKK